MLDLVLEIYREMTARKSFFLPTSVLQGPHASMCLPICGGMDKVQRSDGLHDDHPVIVGVPRDAQGLVVPITPQALAQQVANCPTELGQGRPERACLGHVQSLPACHQLAFMMTNLTSTSIFLSNNALFSLIVATFPKRRGLCGFAKASVATLACLQMIRCSVVVCLPGMRNTDDIDLPFCSGRAIINDSFLYVHFSGRRHKRKQMCNCHKADSALNILRPCPTTPL